MQENKEATSVIDTESLKKQVNLVEVAKKFIETNPLCYDKVGLWWLWDNTEQYWKEIDETDLLNDLYNVFKDVAILNSSFRNQFLTALKMVARSNMPKEVPDSWVQFKDCVYDLANSQRLTISNKYFLTTPIPHLLTNGECPTINKLLKDWCPNQIDLLKEVIACCLVRNYEIQVIFWLIGGGSNGKGSYIRLIERILGKTNCTSSDFARLFNPNNRFELITLYNKLVCMMGETGYNIIRSSTLLKKASGGDPLSAEIKGKTERLDFRNFAKFITASNDLPISKDQSDGYHRRQVIIKFLNKFPVGKEISDTVTEDELNNFCGELVGLASNIYKNGRLNSIDYNVDKQREEYERTSNPLIPFLEKFYEEDVNGYVIKSEFVEEFKKYLLDNKRRQLDFKEITELLKMKGLEERKKKVDEDAKAYAVRVIWGIKLKEHVSKSGQEALEPSKAAKSPNSIYPYICIHEGKTSDSSDSADSNSDNLLSGSSSFDVEGLKRFLRDGFQGGDFETQEVIETAMVRFKITKETVQGFIKGMLEDGSLMQFKGGRYKLVTGREVSA